MKRDDLYMRDMMIQDSHDDKCVDGDYQQQIKKSTKGIRMSG